MIKVGILGAGQLSRMLAQSAHSLGITPVVYAQNSSEPACQITPEQVIGSFDDGQALRSFFESVDLVIFENEFLPFEHIKEAAKGLETKFSPSLSVMEQLSDKCIQKRILSELDIPTAKTMIFDHNLPLVTWIVDVLSEFTRGVVFKWGKRGYDGKGVLIGKREPKVIESFLTEGLHRGATLYAEELIAFERELAMIGCLSTKGDFLAYPLVVSVQEDGICRLVKGPATILGVSPETEGTVAQYLERLARSTGMIGTFGVELFETSDGKIFVNEIAPRVHNSGHYTQNASKSSQFENHLRAVLGQPLGSVESMPAFAMLNILGPEGVTQSKEVVPIPSQSVSLHWYGKGGIRPRRKLGHLNAISYETSSLARLIEELYSCEESWKGKLGVE